MNKFICPMHPEVTFDKPGVCPKCGMTLVEAEKKMDHNSIDQDEHDK